MYIYIVGSVISSAIFVISFLKCKKYKPKCYKEYTPITIKHTGPNNRDGFSKKKIPNNIDTIIIGSGIGGLTTASLLSRTGQTVLVLEQHYVAGGCTHCFEDEGFEFDTGIHYIGNIKSRNKVLNVITQNGIEWVRLGHDNDFIYDTIIVDSKRYAFKPGKETMIQYLSELFPLESNNIRKYIDIVQHVAKLELFFMAKIVRPQWLGYLIRTFLCDEFKTFAKKSVKDVLRQYFKDEQLMAVLGGLSIDGGPPPKKQSFFIHASILNHFIEGGYYPVGGPSIFAKEIIPIIEKAGGRVLVRAPVSEILIEDGKACGVLVKGNKIYAKNIVSNTGVKTTYLKLLKEEKYNKYFNNIFKEVPSELSYNFLFVGLKGNSEELGLNSSNIYIWTENSFDKVVEEYYKDPFSGDHLPPMFIASSSAKDPEWIKKYPNKSTVCVISWSKTNMFNNSNKPRKRKDEEYVENKKKVEKMLWNLLYDEFPKCRNKVLYSSTSTSETVKYYLGSYEGECYGLDATTERFKFNELKPETNVPNLYLTGQDIVTSGFAGAMTAGILTASSILKYGTILDIIIGRNIIKDINNT